MVFMRERLAKQGGRALAAGALVFAGLILGACSTGGIGKTSYHGYVVSDTALEQVPIGSSREQALIALGTPSTTGNFGGEVFYYISQTRHQSVAFMPEKVVDQRVLAVYMDEDGNVKQIADYGLKDGKVFDFVAKATPTGGRDSNFLQQVLEGALNAGNSFGK